LLTFFSLQQTPRALVSFLILDLFVVRVPSILPAGLLTLVRILQDSHVFWFPFWILVHRAVHALISVLVPPVPWQAFSFQPIVEAFIVSSNLLFDPIPD
jgi:hypothetical protein